MRYAERNSRLNTFLEDRLPMSLHQVSKSHQMDVTIWLLCWHENSALCFELTQGHESTVRVGHCLFRIQEATRFEVHALEFFKECTQKKGSEKDHRTLYPYAADFIRHHTIQTRLLSSRNMSWITSMLFDTGIRQQSRPDLTGDGESSPWGNYPEPEMRSLEAKKEKILVFAIWSICFVQFKWTARCVRMILWSYKKRC